GRRQRRSVRSAGGELDEVAAARRDRSAQCGRLPARAGSGCVLERPAVDCDGARTPVEELDVVVGVRGAAVAAGGIDLGEDETPRAAAAGRAGGEREREGREQDEQMDAFHEASDPGEVDGPLLQPAASRRQCPLRSWHGVGTALGRFEAWNRWSGHGRSPPSGTSAYAPTCRPTSRSSTPTPTSGRTSTGWSDAPRS